GVPEYGQRVAVQAVEVGELDRDGRVRPVGRRGLDRGGDGPAGGGGVTERGGRRGGRTRQHGPGGAGQLGLGRVQQRDRGGRLADVDQHGGLAREGLGGRARLPRLGGGGAGAVVAPPRQVRPAAVELLLPGEGRGPGQHGGDLHAAGRVDRVPGGLVQPLD